MVVGDTQSYIFPLTASGGSGGTTKPNILELLYTEGAEITPEDWGSANLHGQNYVPAIVGGVECKKIAFPATQTTFVSMPTSEKLEEYDSGTGMTATSADAGWGFLYSQKLRKLTLGANCLPFGTNGFGDNSLLTEVHYLGTVDQWASAARATNYRKASPFGSSQEGHFYLGNSDTPLTELAITGDSITTAAFAWFVDITKADIGANVTEIETRVFLGCSALETLILRGNTAKTLANVSALTDTPIADGTGYIYVPAALLDTYKTETNWATVAEQFRTIEDYPDITG